MSFASDLRGFTVRASNNADQIFRGTTISLFSNIVKRTPVLSGRLKGNWQIDVNARPTGTVEEVDASAINDLDSASVNKIAAGVQQASIGDSIYMTNNLPYALPIERGRVEGVDGTTGSLQAPAGMVEVSAAEFSREIQRQARLVR
jgi:hypothetical protein